MKKNPFLILAPFVNGWVLEMVGLIWKKNVLSPSSCSFLQFFPFFPFFPIPPFLLLTSFFDCSHILLFFFSLPPVLLLTSSFSVSHTLLFIFTLPPFLFFTPSLSFSLFLLFGQRQCRMGRHSVCLYIRTSVCPSVCPSLSPLAGLQTLLAGPPTLPCYN